MGRGILASVKNDPHIKAQIATLAKNLGFATMGIANVTPISDEYTNKYDRFIQSGYHGQMGYLARNTEKRFDPAKLVDGCESVICLAVSYAPAEPAKPSGAGLVARFARGGDYHDVLKLRCKKLIEQIAELSPGFRGRAFVDAGPVMERTLACGGGLGWIGRNGCLIVPGLGSYVVLCEIFCNFPLPTGEPIAGSCGDCSACIDACPTGACLGDGLVDARECLSYQTVENRGVIDRKYWHMMGVRVFGCDSCQAACPHNKDLPAGDDELLGRGNQLAGASLAEMLTWSAPRWAQACRGTAAERTGAEALARNAIIAAGNSGDKSLVGSLNACRSAWPGWAEVIDWAIDRLAESNQV